MTRVACNKIKIIENELRKAFCFLHKDVDNCVSIDMLNGGITNTVYLITFDDNEKFIIRKYGKNTDFFIDRFFEIRVIEALEPYDITRNILAKLENGLIEQYLEGASLTIDDFNNPLLIELLGKRLSKLHLVNILSPNERKPMVWNKIDIWYTECLKLYKNEPHNLKNIQTIWEKVKIQKNDPILLNNHTVFCHNDLTPGNIILSPKLDDIRFIDFEYASYNNRGFDIGNLFNEFAGYDCDWTKLPNKTERYSFYKHYLGNDNINSLQTLDAEVLFYMPVSHLFWSLWAFIQHKYSDVKFDYLSYANKRLSKAINYR